MARSRGESTGERRHVALVGFMGSGKTTVGKLLAQRLGCSFVDLDETISKKAGRTIPEIFREHGEVGFRAHERAALREVLESPTPIVLATGGGTFADASMRGWVQAAARTVYLATSVESVIARVGAGAGRAARPLLAGPDPAATVRRLLADRGAAYEQSELTVRTDDASCEEVAEEVLHALKERPRPAPRAPTGRAEPAPRPAAERPLPSRGPAAHPPPAHLPIEDEGDDDAPARGGFVADGSALLRVHASTGSYPVELKPEAGDWIAEGITAVCPGERLAIISDTTVAPLHAAPLVEALSARGKRVTLHAFAPGEESKTLATVGALHDELLGAGLSRKDAVIALGGGVVGDVAGFVASTLLRGVPFVQVPTTTLAAVDSSVGGKTGVNTARGKNLVGTFHAPRGVFVAGSHLATQTLRQHAAGLVEAVKMAAALDAVAFEAFVRDAPALLAFDATALARTIARAVGLKAGVVGRDEREEGERAVLNYGHTVGHAIETGEGYRLLHGEAVGLGMLAEAAWAEAAGLADDVLPPLTSALAALKVPTRWADAHIDVAAMGLDKKRQAGGVALPIVTRIGSYELRTVPLERLTRFLEERSG